MKLSNFPILVPAFTARILIDTPLPISTDLLNIPFLPRSGSLTSEPDYPYRLHAAFIQGSDYLRQDRDGEHVRLDAISTAQDVSGALIRFAYTGIAGMEGSEGRVIRGDKNASTTGFGQVFVQANFETDFPGLEAIGNKMYVGSGRFIVQEGKPIVVEYKISELAAPCED